MGELSGRSYLRRLRDRLRRRPTIEFSDRYSALGIPHPDPATVCHGPCEGVGFYPENDPDVIAAAGKEPDDIGYAFLTCPDCNGSGRRDG